MKTKTIFEEEILKEVQALPAPDQERMAKFVRFFKKEIVLSDVDEKKATREFLSICGSWKDGRSVEKQIKDICSGS